MCVSVSVCVSVFVCVRRVPQKSHQCMQHEVGKCKLIPLSLGLILLSL